MNERSWIKKPLDRDDIRETSRRYDISPLEASILARRGFLQPEQLLFFLENHVIFLHSPFLFKEMPTAVERISQAILSEEKIGVFGDCDADGICSTVLLVEYFKKQNNEPIFLVPEGVETHGITSDAINYFHQQGVTLLVCLDNGSRSNDILEKAYQLKIDPIILDHHSTDERPSFSYAYINPILEPAYSNKHLSTSSLVLKFLQALDFSKTAYYEKTLCLIVVQEKKESLWIEVLFTVNLLPKYQTTFLLSENNQDAQKFLDSIHGYQLYSFDVKTQCSLLKNFFHADVYIEDLKNYLEGSLKKLKNLTFKELHENSSLRKFFPRKTHVDVLLLLFQLIVFCNKKLLPNFWNSFDLATIGLVSDMMPMCDENRIIARIGLKQLNAPHRTSLVLLLTHLNLLDNPINNRTIGWEIGPVINSSGRMGQARKSIHFFLAQSYEDQEKYLQNILELHQKRQNLTDSLFSKIYNLAQESYERSKGFSIFIYTEDLPRGFTGLLANRLKKKFSQSLIVVAAKGGSGQISASIRTNTDSIILPFLKKYSQLFQDYGGHERAGGFVIKSSLKKKIQDIVESFTPENKEQNKEENNVIYIDAELFATKFPQEIFAIIDKFAPYGQYFEPLIFMTCESLITKIQLIGKLSQHLKLTLKIDNLLLTAIWWQKSEISESLVLNQKIDVLYHIFDSKISSNKILHIIDLKISNTK